MLIPYECPCVSSHCSPSSPPALQSISYSDLGRGFPLEEAVGVNVGVEPQVGKRRKLSGVGALSNQLASTDDPILRMGVVVVVPVAAAAAASIAHQRMGVV